MNISIRSMKEEDYKRVKEIYLQGIKTKIATFQTEAPTYDSWDKGHLTICRYVAVNDSNRVVGWIALSPISSRCVYRGVAEVSIYIDQEVRKKGVGKQLLQKMIDESEKQGIWTLQSSIFELNDASIALHKNCGFRIVGVRERIAKDVDGFWRNTVFMERRSKLIH